MAGEPRTDWTLAEKLVATAFADSDHGELCRPNGPNAEAHCAIEALRENADEWLAPASSTRVVEDEPPPSGIVEPQGSPTRPAGLDGLRAALTKIADRHAEDPDGGMGWRTDVEGGYGHYDHACRECGTSDEYAVEWPCATRKIADAALAGEPTGSTVPEGLRIAEPAGSSTPVSPTDGLDAAWARAEAALPSEGGWRMYEVVCYRRGEWRATAVPTPQNKSVPRIGGGYGPPATMWLGKSAEGPTPAAALNALAARLVSEQGSMIPEGEVTRE